MMPLVSTMPKSADAMPATAMTQLVATIMMMEPMCCASELTSVLMDWFIDCATESTSFETSERTSPVGLRSRNLSGSRSILSETSERIRAVAYWVALAMRYPCAKFSRKPTA